MGGKKQPPFDIDLVLGIIAERCASNNLLIKSDIEAILKDCRIKDIRAAYPLVRDALNSDSPVYKRLNLQIETKHYGSFNIIGPLGFSSDESYTDAIAKANQRIDKESRKIGEDASYWKSVLEGSGKRVDKERW